MINAATTRWRRDAFDPSLAHLPDPTAPIAMRRRMEQGLCGRYLRRDALPDSDTLLCPDCGKLDGEQSAGGGTTPSAGGC
jgi:hypothetical protein